MNRAFLSAAFAALLAFPTFSMAQETPAADEAQPGTTLVEGPTEGRRLEVLTSTARKREESAQSVPIPITTLSESFIESRFDTDISDIDKYAPNVELGGIDFTGGGLAASIRGVSFNDLEKTFEPAVGLSIDGVFLGTNSGALIDLFDIESVEILRGPQGTLFGRNTIGGVINVRRTRPTGEFGAKLGFRYGSYNRQDYKLVINAPIVQDVLAVKVAGFINKDDQFTRNIFSGKREDGQDVKAFSGSVLFTPTENFEALLTVDYYDDNSTFEGAIDLTVPQGGTTFCDIFGGLGIPGPAGGVIGCFTSSYSVGEENKFKVSFTPPEIPFRSEIDSIFVAFEMQWDLGDFTLVSITGYKDQDELLDEENTGSPFAGLGDPFTAATGIARAIRVQTYEQISQELRLESNLSGPFNFVAGLYYFHSEYFLEPQAFGVFGNLAQRFRAGQDSDAYAIFAEGNYEVTEKLRLFGGFRFTWEKKNFFNTVFNVPAGAVPFALPDVLDFNIPLDVAFETDARETWSEPTWRIGVDYAVTDQMLVYFTYSRGFRSGGFNGRCVTLVFCETPYDPEKVDNFELGFKSDWFDNRLRLNVSGFYTIYDNKQEEVITPSPNGLATETAVRNAAKVTIAGFEMEFQAVPADWLNLYGSLGYLHSEYDEFFIFDPDIGEDVDVSDIATLRLAPKWNFNLGADFIFPVGNGGEITFNANFQWTDKFSSSPFTDEFGPSTIGFRRNIIDDHAQFDFSITYRGQIGAGDADYRISFFVKDAFNDEGRIARTLDAGPFYFGTMVPGRLWGIELDIEI